MTTERDPFPANHIEWQSLRKNNMTEIDALGAWTPTESKEIPKEELWSLDGTLTDFILPRIKAFRKMDRAGYPDSMSIRTGLDTEGTTNDDRNAAEWENILFDIEIAFQLLRDQEFDPMEDRWVDRRTSTEVSPQEAINKGLALFAKYYESLWT